MVQRAGHAGFRFGDVQLAHHLAKTIAVFGLIDGVWRSSQDGHSSRRQFRGDIQRRLAAELDDHALGPLFVADGQNVLDRQGLEIQLVSRIVIGRNGFRIAVHHDRFQALVAERERGMDAAIIELDPLPDPIRTAAQDHDLAACRDRGRIGVMIAAVVISRVVHTADVNGMKTGNQSQGFPLCADLVFGDVQ